MKKVVRTRERSPPASAARLRLAIQAAAGADRSAAALLERIDDARAESMGVHARRAAQTGQLAVPEDECRDVLLAMTDGSLWHTLVARRGWSDERYAAWLGEQLVAALARPSPTGLSQADLGPAGGGNGPS